MAETLRVKVVTPQGSIIDEEALSFTASSPMGQFCMLPNHRPIMAALKTGIMMAERANNQKAVYATDSGFLEGASDHVNVITEQCIPADQIDREAVTTEINEIKDKLKNIDVTTPESEELLKALNWAEVRLEAAGS